MDTIHTAPTPADDRPLREVLAEEKAAEKYTSPRNPGEVADIYIDVYGDEENALEGSARLVSLIGLDPDEDTETWRVKFTGCPDDPVVRRRIPLPRNAARRRAEALRADVNALRLAEKALAVEDPARQRLLAMAERLESSLVGDEYCACHRGKPHGPTTDCPDCGGTGWASSDAPAGKLLYTGWNHDWTEEVEDLPVVVVDVDRLSSMGAHPDRITVRDDSGTEWDCTSDCLRSAADPDPFDQPDRPTDEPDIDDRRRGHEMQCSFDDPGYDEAEPDPFDLDQPTETARVRHNPAKENWIATDDDRTAIYGIGHSFTDALEDARAGNPEGAFVTMRCTAGLYARVERDGGGPDVRWQTLRACGETIAMLGTD